MMSTPGIAWDRLIEVRERRQRLAFEAMLAERRAAALSRAEAERELAAWQGRVDAKGAHWQATRGALAGGGVSVAQLCAAAAWSGALDASIAQQAGKVQRSEAAAAQSERALDASRERLRAAAGRVETATQTRAREHAKRQRLGDARTEVATEEFAAARWFAGRPA
jgi:hypothetical protein